MTQEFVTLPRNVVEQALEALREAQVLMERFQDEKLRRSAMEALRAALEQRQANQPAMTPIAQRKLDSLLTEGYTISGYSIYHEQKHQHGFVTGAGLVGWWRPDGVEYPQPQVEQEPVVWQYRMRPDWGSNKDFWGPWQNCTMEQAAMYQRVPLLHDWAYESRQLYTRPQPKREPLTNEQVKAGLIHLIEYTDARERCAFNIGVRFAERAHNIK